MTLERDPLRRSVRFFPCLISGSGLGSLSNALLIRAHLSTSSHAQCLHLHRLSATVIALNVSDLLLWARDVTNRALAKKSIACNRIICGIYSNVEHARTSPETGKSLFFARTLRKLHVVYPYRQHTFVLVAPARWFALRAVGCLLQGRVFSCLKIMISIKNSSY